MSGFAARLHRKTHLILLFSKILFVLLSFILMVTVSCIYLEKTYDRQPGQDIGKEIEEAGLVIIALGVVFATGLCAMLIHSERKVLDVMRKAEDDLRVALAVAEDSARTKSEFLDTMSHELRTPMNGVMGFLQIALSSPTLENQRETLKHAGDSANDLMKIINDILDYTEIESGRMKSAVVPFQISDIFSDLSKAFALRTKMAGLTLSISYPTDFPPVLVGDPHNLSRVLGNLVDNAIKFTKQGKVTVRANIKSIGVDKVEAVFKISDTGIGIKDEQMRYLFDPFWQADSSATRQYGGTGFGLALSKLLVTMLGGKIWVESVYDEGSTFYFTASFGLPAASKKPAGADKGTVIFSNHLNIGGAICNASPKATTHSIGAI